MVRALLLAAPLCTTLMATTSFAAAQHDAAWYMANAEALQSELSACTANPGDLAGTPDCVNAEAAQRQIDVRAL